ncbi:MAG: hypothetical protein K0Q71_4974 [Thermomicrobiales bacterium]|nr:hypothetical protein [Thermomicrobiales bacterium]
MDDRAFEELTRRVGKQRSRRGMLQAAAAGLSAPVLGVFGVQYAAAQDVEGEAFGFCRPGGFPCGRNQQCCTDKCRNGVCACAKKGKPCINRVGANCCSKRCRKGKCR